MPNAMSLTVAGVDRGGLGGALVGAHREHALAERRPAQVPDEHAQRDHGDQRDPAEYRARLIAVESAVGRPRTEVETDQAEVGHRRAVRPDAPGGVEKPKFAIATAPARVTTVRLTPRTRSAETAVISPITTATATPASGGEREAEAGVDGDVRDREAGRPGQGELDHRDLADEASDDDQRQRHHAPISDTTSAWRKSNGRTTSATAQTAASGRATGEQPLRPRRRGQPLLDHLTAGRYPRAAQEHRHNDDHECEQLLDAGIAVPSVVGNQGCTEA